MSLSTLLDDLVLSAHRLARDLGHIPEPWSRSSKYEHVTFCRSCGFAAVANSNPAREDGPYSGSILEVFCRGSLTSPTWAPQIMENQSAA